MSDDKKDTRRKILGELESIKTLLHEQESTAEPPLLTEVLEDGNSSDLREARAGQSSQGDAQYADVPTLHSTVEDAAADEPPEAAASDDQTPSSSADEPADPSAAMQDSIAEEDEPVEEQPGLFDGEEAGGTAPALKPAAPAPRLSKGENPFLPKHIRDRLSANRARQQEILSSFQQSAPTTPAPTADDETAADADKLGGQNPEELVDKLVQRFLPEIEAELRKELRAILEAERQSSSSDD